MSRPTALAIRDVALAIACALAFATAGGVIGFGIVEVTLHVGLIAIPITLGVLFAVALLVALAAHLIARKRGEP